MLESQLFDALLYDVNHWRLMSRTAQSLSPVDSKMSHTDAFMFTLVGK